MLIWFFTVLVLLFMFSFGVRMIINIREPTQYYKDNVFDAVPGADLYPSRRDLALERAANLEHLNEMLPHTDPDILEVCVRCSSSIAKWGRSRNAFDADEHNVIDVRECGFMGCGDPVCEPYCADAKRLGDSLKEDVDTIYIEALSAYRVCSSGIITTNELRNIHPPEFEYEKRK